MGFSDDASELAKTLALRYKVGIILGGLPSEADVMPSVIFIILYASLFLFVFWRIKTHTLTFGHLWKPLLVVMLRIATYAMRIKLSEQQQQWINDIFVTELVLLRIGPIILSSAMICLFRDAVLPYLPTIAHPNIYLTLSLKHFVTLLNMATYFTLGLTIAIAFDVKQAIDGNSEARVKMHKSKMISIWMMVAIDACIYLLTVVPLVLLHQGRYVKHLVVNKTREETKFMAILSVCTFLVVVSAFKAAQLSGHDLGSFSRYNIVVNQKILFYCVCCAGEFVACALLLSLAWARIVPPPELLEAYCRIHKQGNGDHSGNANVVGQDGSPSGTEWPVPPTRAAGQVSQSGLSEGTPTYCGMSGAQTCRMVPRHATVQSVTVDKGTPEYEEWSDIPFSANATRGDMAVSQAKLVSFAPNQTSRRTSAGSLSTISEVGEEKSASPPSIQSTEPSKKISTMRKCSESLESLALPPTLLPHAPPEVMQATAAHALHRSRSLTAPQNNPKRPRTPNFNAPAEENDIGLTVTTPIKHDANYGEPDVFGSHLAVPAPVTATVSLSHAPLHVVTVTESPAPAIAPSSACSIRSHWSEDSDDEDRHRDSNGSGSGHRSRFMRHRREIKSGGGESAKSLQWE